eukprot:TRINITY_DN11089_c0_g6_i1.p1 TRINITY_DN11089_c0_g6~~TRINITY_DN11089_c0_g6_i1.p1  ORF type:complete len:271 (-),score=51.84 TRINITY_DN11089_c0_g6_i1:185-997(-)
MYGCIKLAYKFCDLKCKTKLHKELRFPEKNVSKNSFISKPTFELIVKRQQYRSKTTQILSTIEDSIIDLTKNCGSRSCRTHFTEKELMLEWSKQPKEHTVKCPCCEGAFTPSLKVTNTVLGNTASHRLLFPRLFVKEIEMILEYEGVASFFSSEFYEKRNELFWNTIFYLQLVDKPSFMLSLHFDSEIVQKSLKPAATPRDVFSFSCLFEQWRKSKINTMNGMFKKNREMGKEGLLSTTYEEYETEKGIEREYTISDIDSFTTPMMSTFA